MKTFRICLPKTCSSGPKHVKLCHGRCKKALRRALNEADWEYDGKWEIKKQKTDDSATWQRWSQVYRITSCSCTLASPSITLHMGGSCINCCQQRIWICTVLSPRVCILGGGGSYRGGNATCRARICTPLIQSCFRWSQVNPNQVNYCKCLLNTKLVWLAAH